MKKTFIVFVLIVQVIMFVSCKKSAEVAVPEVKAANLEVSSFAVTGERDEVASAQAEIISDTFGDTGAGYVYTITLGVAETIGGVATVNSVEFSFYNNGEMFGTYTPDVTTLFDNTRISAGANVMANEKRVASSAGVPFADEVQVLISYTDETSAAKTATAAYYGPQYQDADIVVVEGTVGLTNLWGMIFGEADVENRGTHDASSYTLFLYFYNNSDTMVNQMSKAMNETLSINERKTVSGICLDSSFDEIVKYAWRVKWTKADGTVMSKSGEGAL